MTNAVTKPVTELHDSTPLFSLGSFTPSASALLVMFTQWTGANADGGTMSNTGTPLTWTERDSNTQVQASNNHRFKTFTAQCGVTPGAMVITFAPTGGTTNGCSIVPLMVTGHNQLFPIRQSIFTDEFVGANPGITFPLAVLTANSILMAAGTVTRQPPVSAVPSGWTEAVDGGYASPATGITAGFRANGETDTSYVFTSVTGTWHITGLEINEAANGNPVVAKFMRSYRQRRAA